MYSTALDVSTRRLPHFQRLGVIEKVDANLLQKKIGIFLDNLQTLFIEVL